MDFSRQNREHTPITIEKTPVERVNSFKFIGVHITEDLTWSTHTDAVLKKAHQRLFFLRRLRKFGMSPSIVRSFYSCTVESILTCSITAWFGNSTAGKHKTLVIYCFFNTKLNRWRTLRLVCSSTLTVVSDFTLCVRSGYPLSPVHASESPLRLSLCLLLVLRWFLSGLSMPITAIKHRCSSFCT